MNDSEGNFWKGMAAGWFSSKLFSGSKEENSPEGCLISILWAPFLLLGIIFWTQDGFLKFLRIAVLDPALIALAVFIVFQLIKSKLSGIGGDGGPKGKKDQEIVMLYNAGQYTRALEIAEQNANKSPFAAHAAGLCYFNGEGCSQDLNKAFSYFSKAKDKNVEAAYHYGAMLLVGAGTEKDEATGFEWLKKLALKKNHISARGNYGYALFKGLGCEKNQAEGIKQMRIACDAGDSYTKYQLGCILYSGEDETPIDENGGLRLLREAAEAGEPEAQTYLKEIGMA